MAALTPFRALPALLQGCRGLTCSSASFDTHAPTYTYTPPGSSIAEPRYFSEPGAAPKDRNAPRPGEASVLREPAHRVSLAKKASMLRSLAPRKRKLAAPGGGASMLLPPGSSIKDPAYSIKDPVYFIDKP